MTQSQLEQIAMTATVQESNPFFKALTAIITKVVNKHSADMAPLFTPLFYTEMEDDVITIVQCQGKFSAYQGERFVIRTSSGSHICLKSFNNDVDITRIISEEKGDGTLLMDLLMIAYNILKELLEKGGKKTSGTLILECVGSVGLNENKRDMPVKDQAAFFRKFGFRKVGKYNPNHLHMSL